MPERTVTPGQILTWANEIANGFVNKGESLFDGAKKVAMDHGLNEHQISLVCQGSNQATFKAMSTTNPNMLFEFPVVKGEDVVSALSAPQTKVAAIDDSDYKGPPPRSPLAMSIDEVFERLFPKVASDKPSLGVMAEQAEKLSKLSAEINKAAAMEGEARSMAVGADIRRDQREEDFYQVVRTMLLEGKTLEEVYDDLMIDKDSVEDDMVSSSEVKSLMRTIMDRLKAENLIDQAQEMPNDTPAMQVSTSDNKPEYKTASARFTALVKQAAEARVYREVLAGVRNDLEEKQAAYVDYKKEIGK